MKTIVTVENPQHTRNSDFELTVMDTVPILLTFTACSCPNSLVLLHQPTVLCPSLVLVTRDPATQYTYMSELRPRKWGQTAGAEAVPGGGRQSGRRSCSVNLQLTNGSEVAIALKVRAIATKIQLHAALCKELVRHCPSHLTQYQNLSTGNFPSQCDRC